MPYSDEDFQAAVAEATRSATAALTQRLAELESAQAAAGTEAAVAEATTALQAQIADLRSSLDERVLALTAAQTAQATAEQALADRLTAEQEAEAQRLVAEEAAGRRQTRIEAVAQIVEFPADHVEASADGWAAMTDAEFDAQLAHFRVLAERLPATPPPPPPPVRSPLSAAAEPRTGSKSSLTELFDLRHQGISVRSER